MKRLRTDERRKYDREAKQAKRDRQKADGTYVRQVQLKRTYVRMCLVDPDDYSHPMSDVRMGA